jgi:acyl-CoA reductase-like NAD-dependent aldehyde dehydrogenase
MAAVIDALATGNAVLFCGSEHHPRVNETIRRLFQRAGFPDNLVQVLGGDSDTIRTLVGLGPDKLLFDGDPDLAERLAPRCAASGCEFQGVRKVKNILLILKDADLETAVSAALTGAFAYGGMRGASIERIVIDGGIYDEFRMMFMEAIRTMNSHHAQLASINDIFNPRRAQMLVDDAVAKGARVTYPAGEEPGRWIHWKAAVFEALSGKAKLATERYEGPGCALYRAESPLEEVRGLMRQLPAAGLSVLGTPDRELRARLEALPVARVSFNDPVFGGDALYGGVPAGPEVVRSGAGPLSMLRAKVITDAEPRTRRVGWFPYTDDKAYALMDVIEAVYGASAGRRVKAALKITVNPTMRRLLRGRD